MFFVLIRPGVNRIGFLTYIRRKAGAKPATWACVRCPPPRPRAESACFCSIVHAGLSLAAQGAAGVFNLIDCCSTLRIVVRQFHRSDKAFSEAVFSQGVVEITVCTGCHPFLRDGMRLLVEKLVLIGRWQVRRVSNQACFSITRSMPSFSISLIDLPLDCATSVRAAWRSGVVRVVTFPLKCL